MFRYLPIALMLASTAPAAARVGPEIAYSTSTEVYLVNPDGTGKVRLYRSKSNDFISSVALKPGGGALAIVENWALKFISYDAQGRIQGTVRAVKPTCYRLADVSYSADGNSVLYREVCPNGAVVKQVAVPTAAAPNPVPQTLFSNAALQDLGPWEAGGTSFLYTTIAVDHMELRRHFTDGSPDPADPIAVSNPSTDQIRYADASPDGSKILISDSPKDAAAYPSPGFTSEIDAVTGSVIRSNVTGRDANYAPDSVRFVFIVANSYNDQYLRYLDSTNQVKQIAGRAHYSSVDWGD